MKICISQSSHCRASSSAQLWWMYLCVWVTAPTECPKSWYPSKWKIFQSRIFSWKIHQTSISLNQSKNVWVALCSIWKLNLSNRWRNTRDWSKIQTNKNRSNSWSFCWICLTVALWMYSSVFKICWTRSTYVIVTMMTWRLTFKRAKASSMRWSKSLRNKPNTKLCFSRRRRKMPSSGFQRGFAHL